ncbi:DUF1385 domain-containing protein [Halanaerocella petrolearia]
MKIGGRAYKNGVSLFGKHYSVKAYYEDGNLFCQVGKNTLADNRLYQLLKKVPFLRGIISLLFSLYFFFKEATSNPKRFWPILLLLATDIALEFYFIFFPNSSTQMMDIIFFLPPIVYWGGIVLLAIILRQTLLQEIFKFHGAEHKAVNYYQSQFTKKINSHSRLARRCGTNLVTLYLILTIVIEYFGLGFNLYLQTLLVLGIAYELLLLLPDSLMNIPFLVQRFTTVEPDDKHLRAAENALNILISKEKEIESEIVV